MLMVGGGGAAGATGAAGSACSDAGAEVEADAAGAMAAGTPTRVRWRGGSERTSRPMPPAAWFTSFTIGGMRNISWGVPLRSIIHTRPAPVVPNTPAPDRAAPGWPRS